VQLQRLTAGEAEGRTAHFVAQVQFGQQLPAGELAAGHFRADHETVRFAALARLARGGPVVTVVLLVRAVVLEQLLVGLAEAVVSVQQFLRDGSRR